MNQLQFARIIMDNVQSKLRLLDNSLTDILPIGYSAFSEEIQTVKAEIAILKLKLADLETLTDKLIEEGTE